MNIVEAHDLHKRYGPLEVLRGVNLSIAAGELVAIVGASGAGKTTLLQLLGTLDRPTSGRVLINGADPFTLPQKALSHFRNQQLGFVFQFSQLLPEFTAAENIMLPALIAGQTRTQASARAQELLDTLNLTNRADHKPAQLSGGEKQRVAIARALCNHPAIILADEPSGNLDSRNAEDLQDLFRSLRDQSGQTFAIVTHDERLATRCDRIIRISDGLIQQ